MADLCQGCNKKVAKTAKALACDLCRNWYQLPCGGIEDADYDFMRHRRGHGFRWFCRECVPDVDIAHWTRSAGQLGDKLTTIVSGTLVGITDRLSAVEDRLEGVGDLSQEIKEETKSFAEVVKRTVKGAEKDVELVTRVTDHGETKAIRRDEVLVIRPVRPEGAEAPSPPVPISSIENILKSVPVSSCRKSKTGGIVVKFPNREAKAEASTLMGTMDVVVSEPRKMLPKMTLTEVPTTLPDEEIIPAIKSKNSKIKGLIDDGHALPLIFTRAKDQKKIGVLKMTLEIGSTIVLNGGRVFLGLQSCRANDRFWATQSHHCQRFGHVAERCPNKDSPSVCCFCSGSHESRWCPDRTILKYTNCFSDDKPRKTWHHSASSLDCPVMRSERRRVIENTDFGHSKNVQCSQEDH